MGADGIRVPVIVAEDDEQTRLLFQQTAEQHGWHDLRLANSAPEAVAMWRSAREDAPDVVVVLDVWMPGMLGIDAAETILAERPGQLVILISVALDETITRRAREAGVHACVTKAQLRDELPLMLDAWTRRGSRQ